MAFRANKRPRLNSVAVPIVGEFLLGMTVAMGGLWLSSQTSDAAAGSFGLAIQICESLYVLFRVLAIGVGVVTTQALGGKQHEVARRTALVGLGASTWAGLLAALCVLLGNELILDVLNAPDEVLPIAAPYLQLLAPALVLEAYNLTMAAILRAHLHARESLLLMVAMHGSHLLLAIPLMLGVGDWDGFGLPGYAYALLASRALGLGLHLWLWRKLMDLGPQGRDWWAVPLGTLAPVLRIGLPGAAMEMVYRVCFMVSLATTAKLGVAALATHSYTLQTLKYVLIVSMSIGWACEIMVGRLVGGGARTGAQGRAQRAARLGEPRDPGRTRRALADARLHARPGDHPRGADAAVDLVRARNRSGLQPHHQRRAARHRRRDLSGGRRGGFVDPGSRRRLVLPRPQVRAAGHLRRVRGRRMDPRAALDGALVVARLVAVCA
jgi:Na+-driven multidrug efflux pump